MKPTMNFSHQISKYLYFTSIFFLAIGCNGPEDLDLTNIENEVITFYDDLDDEIIFPSMYITTFNNQEIVDDPKIDAELSVVEELTQLKYNIGVIYFFNSYSLVCFVKSVLKNNIYFV